MECIGPSVLYPNHEFDMLPTLTGDFLLNRIIISIKQIIANITKNHHDIKEKIEARYKDLSALASLDAKTAMELVKEK